MKCECAAFVGFKKVKLISTGVYKRILLYKDKNKAGKNGQTGFLISGRKKIGLDNKIYYYT